jgi:hypothetical protein
MPKETRPADFQETVSGKFLGDYILAWEEQTTKFKF